MPSRVLILTISLFIIVPATPIVAEMINGSTSNSAVMTPLDVVNLPPMNYVSHSIDIQQNVSYFGFHQFTSTDSRTGVSYFSPTNNMLYISGTSPHSSNLGPGRHISVIDLHNWTVVNRFDVPIQPYPGSLSINEWITGIAFDPSNNLLYVSVYEFVNPPFKTVGQAYLYELNASNGSVLNFLMYNNSVFNGMAFNEKDNYLYLTMSFVPTDNPITTPSNSVVLVVIPSNLGIKKIITLGFSPAPPVFDSYNEKLYVPDFTLDGLDVVNMTTYSISKVKLSNFTPVSSYITYSKSSVYVTSFLSNNIIELNSSNFALEDNLQFQKNLSQIQGIAYDSSNNLLYLSEGDVLAINVSNGASQHISVGGGAGPLNYDTLSGEILAGVNGPLVVVAIGLGNQHSVTFSESGVMGKHQWKIMVNGITYVTTNSTITIKVAGNYTSYHFSSNYYLGISPQGVLNNTIQDSASVMFVNVFLIVIPPVLVGALVSVYVFRRLRKK